MNSQGATSTTNGPAAQATGIVRLRDVARVELGSQQYDQSCTLDGEPSVALSIFQLPGSNALETATRVRKKMEEMLGPPIHGGGGSSEWLRWDRDHRDDKKFGPGRGDD